MAQALENKAIRILLFAGLREAAGWSERLWTSSSTEEPLGDLTPKILWGELNLPGHLNDLRVAINGHFATVDSPVQPGDELAFLPPISGG